MAFTKMGSVPNPVPDANGDPFSGAVLKAFLPGTTTPTSIFINSNGDSPQASITANADGIWEVSGNEIVPHIDRKVKWGIFANAADAAANVSFYMGPFDNITVASSESGDNIFTGTNDFSTLTVNNNTVFHEGNINEAVVPINPQVGTAYIFVLGDRGGLLTMDNAAANTVTLPPEASVPFVEGNVLFGKQKGAGQTTIIEGSGVTILRPVSKGLVVAEQGEWFALLKEPGVNIWSLAGTTVN